MKKILFTACLLGFTIACKPPTEQEVRNDHLAVQERIANKLNNHTTYTVDRRTNLCYLVINTNLVTDTYMTFAQVPCTPDVEDIVEGRK